MKEIAGLFNLSEGCGVPQRAHHEGFKPWEQRRLGFICLEARIDLTQYLIALR